MNIFNRTKYDMKKKFKKKSKILYEHEYHTWKSDSPKYSTNEYDTKIMK